MSKECWAAGALLQAGCGVFRADPGLAVQALVVRSHLLDLLVILLFIDLIRIYVINEEVTVGLEPGF